jgi:hypothetical protein
MPSRVADTIMDARAFLPSSPRALRSLSDEEFHAERRRAAQSYAKETKIGTGMTLGDGLLLRETGDTIAE